MSACKPWSCLNLSLLLLSLCFPILAIAAPLTAQLNEKEAALGVSSTPSKLGSRYFLTVTGGTAPYTVTASNDVVKIGPRRSAPGTGFDLTLQKEGKVDLVAMDSTGATATAQFTVFGDANAGFKVSASASTIDLGQSVNVSIQGGTPPYSFKPSEPNRFKIEKTGEASFKLTAILAGGAYVSFNDSKQRSQNIELKAPSLVVKAEKTELAVGESTDLVISGGTSPYKITTGKNVSLQMLSEQKYRLTGSSPGAAPLYLVDGQRADRTLNIVTYQPMSSRLRKLPGKAVWQSNDPKENAENFIRVGEEIELSIAGGVAPLQATASPAGLVEVKTAGNGVFVVAWKSGGNAKVSVKDSIGKECVSSFTVKAEDEFRASLDQSTINSWSVEPVSTKLTVFGGVPPYELRSGLIPLGIEKKGSNEFLLKARARSGKVTLNIFDSRGKQTKPVVLTINPVLLLKEPAKSILINQLLSLTVLDCTPPFKAEIVSGAEFLTKLPGIDYPQKGISGHADDPMMIHYFKGLKKGSAKVRISDGGKGGYQEFVVEIK
jgi:hypothetical protein